MEHRKMLFKEGMSTLSPRQHKIMNRALQQQSRARQRDLQFQQSRNIPTAEKTVKTPQQPSAKKQKCTDSAKGKENKEVVNAKVAENINAAEEHSEKESYRARFVAWKKEREKQKELAKLDKRAKKKPFVPCGKYKGDQKQLLAKSLSMVTDVVTETQNKRHSTYLAAPLPPKKKPVETVLTQPATTRVAQGAACSKSATKATPKKAVAAPINIFLKPMNPTSNVISKNLKTTTAVSGGGAVGKAKALMKKQTVSLPPPQVAARKQYPSAQLAVSMKPKPKKPSGAQKTNAAPVAKRTNSYLNLIVKNRAQVAEPLATPSDIGQAEDFVVTSTQVRPAATSTAGTKSNLGIELFELFKVVNPVSRKEIVSEKRASAKRVLLQNEIPSNPRKFNFLIRHELDISAFGSPIPKSNEKQSSTKKPPSARKTIQEMKTPEGGKQKQKTPLQTLKATTIANTKQQCIPSIKVLQAKQIITEKQHLGGKKYNCFVKNYVINTPLASPLPNQTSGLRNQETPTHHLMTAADNNVRRRSAAKRLLIPEPNKEKQQKNQHGLDAATFRSPVTTSEKLCEPATSAQPETVKSTECNQTAINYLSPFVSVSRGKVNAKQEQEKRNSIYLLETEQTTPTMVKSTESQPTLPVLDVYGTPIEKRRTLEAVRYFRKQLDDETHRLLALCDKWDDYRKQNSKLLQSNAGEDMINVTIGQTKLLTSKKFMQFSGLIDRCEAQANGTAAADDGSESTKTITAIDLEGFWSMLGLQVDNVEKRFGNLERWLANKWEDPDVQDMRPDNKKPIKTKIKQPIKKATVAPKRNTALRQMMLKMMTEIRNKKTEATDNEMICESNVYPDATANATLNENLVVACSPPRLRRRSSNNNKRDSLTPNNSARIKVIVRDRKSFSTAPTIVMVPSPRSSPLVLQHRSLTNAEKLCESKELLKTAVHTARRNSNQKRQAAEQSPAKPRTPETQKNARKSILKTPGTVKTQSRRVVFNEQLSVKKIRKLDFNAGPDDENNVVEQVHIDDFPNMIFQFDSSMEDSEENAYRLRSRRIKLRPSCEFTIPK